MKTETFVEEARGMSMINVLRTVEKPYSRVINASRTCQKHLRPSWENFIPENDSVLNAARSVKHDIENVQNLPSDSFSTLFRARIYKHRYYCVYVLFSLRLTFFFFCFPFRFLLGTDLYPPEYVYRSIQCGNHTVFSYFYFSFFRKLIKI